MQIDEKLLEFATDNQAAAIRAYLEHGTYRKAAESLGIHQSSYCNLLKRVKRNAAKSGWSPEHDMNKTVPDPYVVRGHSTLYGDDGQVKLQWVKTQLDSQKYLELVKEVIDELKRDIEPVNVIDRTSGILKSDLLNFYTLTDIHLGMLSWGEETGADWDLNIAEATILESFRYLIDSSPAAETGFFNQLGDALHYDGMLPVTPTSGHIVDADSRYHKVVRSTMRIFRQVITMLLQKHERVVVLMCAGNHDLSGAVWLQESFAMLFENNPRVEVIVNPSPYYGYMHGKTFIGCHHGHKMNVKKLADAFRAKRWRKMMGESRQAYIHTGHMHHKETIEHPDMIVEMHQTLAAKDAYATHGGYDADRSMNCITYHKAGVEKSRIVYYPEVPDTDAA
jgi:hypothetical protein